MAPTDSGRSGGAGSPGDSEGGPVGSVAEEAARLVEMLAAAGGAWGASPAGAGPGRRESSVPDAQDGRTRDGETEHTCTCGGSTPVACRLCPVCQLISFVSSISPETIDRAADLVGLAATALRDLAATQRGRRPGPDGNAVDDTAPADTAPAGSRPADAPVADTVPAGTAPVDGEGRS